MKKKILIAITLTIAITTSIYLYLYKGHRNIEEETADYVVNITRLEKEFVFNDSLAHTKYQDKTIELTARITAIDSESIGVVLDDKVFATFKDSLPQNIENGKSLKIKGRFLGYDELLEVFKIDQCSVSN